MSESEKRLAEIQRSTSVDSRTGIASVSAQNLDWLVDQALLLEKTLSCLPKVPTEPYEKELAKRLIASEAEGKDWMLRAWKERGRVRKLQRDLDKAVAALEFYANPDNWTYTTYDVCQTITADDLGVVPGHASFGKRTPEGYVYECGGKTAKQALLEIAKERKE